MNKFKVGDKVKLISGLTLESTGIQYDNLIEMNKGIYTIEKIETNKKDETLIFINDGWCFEEDQLVKVEDNMNKNISNIDLEEVKGEDVMKLRIKYFEGATKLNKISKGNWIDVYANKDVFVPVGERAMIPLGFALELPQGWEGHLAPRSSTFKTWGIIQTNHIGVVDDTYIGNNDQWHMPVYCLQGKCYSVCDDQGNLIEITKEEYKKTENSPNCACLTLGTIIRKGDKIGQFRIMEVMPELEFEEVESLGNIDRGGFGSTGTK